MGTWLIYALLAALTASLSTIFTKLGVQNLSSSLAGTIKAIIMAVFFIIISIGKNDFTGVNIFNYKKDLVFLVLTGVCGALSWLFMNIALKYGKVTQVAPIDKLSIVLTVILSALIFKETLSIKAFIGVIFIGVGAILVALF
ncbi:EamA family transporter [Clostridium mediterraneense]|uniref:EamA family transporter n=1 Tax=Clostridium mediterraneense TaxID=1805472 RepID=UPI0008354A13|nr:EamA family transporter [Clostridium mediterraneense]